MRKIRNFLYFFICSFHLNCPTTEEQITDRQVILGVIQKVSSNSKHTLLCLCGHNVLERIYAYTILCMDLCIFIQQSLGIRQKSFNQPQAYSTNPFNFF